MKLKLFAALACGALLLTAQVARAEIKTQMRRI